MVVPEMLSPGGPMLNAMLLEWCASRVTNGSFRNDAVGIGIAKDNDLLAVAVFDNFHKGRSGQPLNIDCSIAAESPKWASRGTIRAILHYPFCQLKVPRVTAMVAENNMRSRRMLERLGFVTEGYVRHCLDNGESMLVTGILRAEASRWIGYE